jgi:hypothetical protein
MPRLVKKTKNNTKQIILWTLGLVLITVMATLAVFAQNNLAQSQDNRPAAYGGRCSYFPKVCPDGTRVFQDPYKGCAYPGCPMPAPGARRAR